MTQHPPGGPAARAALTKIVQRDLGKMEGEGVQVCYSPAVSS